VQGGNQDAGGGGFVGPGGVRFSLPDAGTLTRIAAILLALLLVALAVAARYLRPRTVMGVWQRTLVLARLAGAPVLGGIVETPGLLERLELQHDHALGLPIAFQHLHRTAAHAHLGAVRLQLRRQP